MQTPREPSRHIAADTFAAVVRSYLASPKFTKLAAGTQTNYRYYLKLASAPDILGAVSVHVIRPALVQAFLDGLADRPGTQANALTAIKAVEKFALPRDLLPRDISKGCECIGADGGHTPWSDEQIEIAVRRARPHIARAIMLGAETGQRGSDLIRMGWSDLETVDGRSGINVTQVKTGRRLRVPVTKELAAAIETWERRPTPFLLRTDGTPWPNRNLLSKAWEREKATNPWLAPLHGLVLHGLRGASCVRLRRLGLSEAEISATVGMSIPMVSRYCRFASQWDSAVAAVVRLDEHRENLARRAR